MPKKVKSHAIIPPAVISSVAISEPLLLDINGVARMLSSTPWTVRHLHWSKRLVFKKVGRRFLIHIDDVRAFAAGLKAA
jgi:hypothetical protein